MEGNWSYMMVIWGSLSQLPSSWPPARIGRGWIDHFGSKQLRTPPEVLRKKHVFSLLLMEHEKHTLPFLTLLCSIQGKKEVVVSLQRCWKHEKCEFGLRRESLFLLIPHEGKTNSFRFCNTSWTRMRCLGVYMRNLKWICCCNLAAQF